MTLSKAGRPSFSIRTVGDFVREQYGFVGDIQPLPAEWDQNFHLDTGETGEYVVKISNQGQNSSVLEFQNEAMKKLSELWTSAQCPCIFPTLSGDSISTLTNSEGIPFRVRVLSYLNGRPLEDVRPHSENTLENIGYTLGDLNQCLAEFQHPGMDWELPYWDLRNCEWLSTHTHTISNLKVRGIIERLLLQYRARVTPLLAKLQLSVIHNDANSENLLFAKDAEDEWKVVGLYDFSDMVCTYTVNELAIACRYAIFGAEDPLLGMGHLAAGYHRARPLSESEIQVLFPLMCMRLCVGVTMSALAAAEDPDNPHRRINNERAWEMMVKLSHIDWRQAEDYLLKACGLDIPARLPAPGKSMGVEDLLHERRKWIAPSLSLGYEQPLEIVRGRGQFLFDRSGRAYLDCVNNVPHVGHCHPKVVAALSKQARTLNTNTRYLHPYLTEFARRLTATLPEPLKVCFFVNSGSEANELAVRLARTYTGRRDVIVLEGGYHGNTTTLVELSPYKSEGPGGKGLAEWAHKVVKPDPYRGPYRGYGEDTGRAYAKHVQETCERLVIDGRPPAMFLCEPLMGVGGQIVHPNGFLREAFQHVRAVGGLCVVDEVQVGLGRVGSHMWAFETQGVVPDIVTIGKPMGNGHPLAAVVTTADIAQSFDTGMEYFNTFGGNPVSLAVGLAVLEVIEEEGLRERAARVGHYLREGFRRLSFFHPEIGDVRGLGLFIGVELVTDRQALTPATEMTARLIELVKADGILLSVEGPYHNVLKIKPPLQFGEVDADLLLGAVDRALYKIRVD